jgi:uncharacterized SAM-binding protein YcdF (DUF218 family)
VAELRRLLGVYHGYEGDLEAEEGRPRYAVVLGTQVLPGGRPSRTLDARVRHAARLHAAGRIDRILVTGGVGKHPPSEAEVMGRILRGEGVPAGTIRLEDKAESTWDSARLVAPLVEVDGVAEVLAVTDPLHCVRAVAAFRKVGLKAWAEPVYSSPMWRVPWLRRGQLLRESGALVWYRVRYGVGARSRQ